MWARVAVVLIGFGVGLSALVPGALAQQVVTSAGPQKISVTVYRAPGRGARTEVDRKNPRGFALITETRMVDIPAGRAVVRFEGVAGNIFPESAIVSGLPAGVREKNLDAELLSPRSLFDRALGRRVLIRRTNRATGKVVEEQATIRSGANGAAVLQIGGGYEALRCTGAAEELVFGAVPPGLSAKPTLSIETDSPSAMRAALTLSYLAGGFDWQADYVVRMRADGASADLFAWVTLASNDVTSFAAAGAQVVAGKPNRVGKWEDFGDYGAAALALQCYPSGPPEFETGENRALPRSQVNAPPPPSPLVYASALAQDVVVTGASRKAVQEELGDFKLYRIPQPVTVASNAQKQVALLSQDGVPVAVVYVSEGYEGNVDAPVLTLRARNRKDAGLGLALPAGNVAVFEEAGGRPILIGQAAVADKAVGEEVEYKLGTTPGVSAHVDTLEHKPGRARYRLMVGNANPWPIRYEARLRKSDKAQLSAASARLGDRVGARLWAVTIPANGAVTLDYTITIAPRVN